jgi:UDP-glucose 4-epimerase
MRVVVVGATGNVGTSVVERLIDDPAVESIVGVARRRPGIELPKVEWRAADIGVDDLEPLVAGADAVIHLAWVLQPQHDEPLLFRTNVIGTSRLFDAAGRARVPAFVYASSVGTYACGPKEPRVPESWPATGIPTSFYSRHKAAVERLLDVVGPRHPDVRIVRLRTSLVFKRQAASGIARLFLGPLIPKRLLSPSSIRLVPDTPRFTFQAVHSSDAAAAYHLALQRDVSGPFNVASEPPLTPRVLASLLDARRIPVPAAALRGAAWASWRLRLQRSEEGWIDMALDTPLMDTTRARNELGWRPNWLATDALLDLLEGMRDGAGGPTPPLSPTLPDRDPVVPITPVTGTPHA